MAEYAPQRFVQEGEIVGWRSMSAYGGWDKENPAIMLIGNTSNDPLQCRNMVGRMYGKPIHVIQPGESFDPDCSCGFYLMKHKRMYNYYSGIGLVVNSNMHGLVTDHGDYYRCDRYSYNYFVASRQHVLEKAKEFNIGFDVFSVKVVDFVSGRLGVPGFVGNVKEYVDVELKQRSRLSLRRLGIPKRLRGL